LFCAEPAELMPMPPHLQLVPDRLRAFLHEHDTAGLKLADHSCWIRYCDDLSLLIDSIASAGRLEVITFLNQEADFVDLLAGEESFGREKKAVMDQVRSRYCDAVDLNKQGEEFCLAGDEAAARKAFTEAISLYPAFSTVYINLGLLSYENGDMASALDDMKKAYFFDPYNREVLLNVLAMPGLPENGSYAKQMCDHYLMLNPDDTEVAKLRAESACGKGRTVSNDGNPSRRKATRDISPSKGDNMQTPLQNHDEDIWVTAIVSSYNAEQFMRECLADLVNQTIADRMEIIVVDAASPQSEGAIVADFQRRHNNITYIRTGTRIGVYAAWNIAIQLARGKYITPFSTNDRLRRDAYEIMRAALERNGDMALVYGDTYHTKIPHETFEKHTCCGAFQWPDYSYENLLKTCMIGPHPMWRKSVHESIGLFDESFVALGDQDFFIRVGASFEMLHIPEFTGLYWLSESGLSNREEFYMPEIGRIRSKYPSDTTVGSEVKPSGPMAPAIAAKPSEAATSSAALEKRLEHADSLTKAGRFDDALACYQSILRADKTSHRAMTGIGVVRLVTGKLDEAGDSFIEALRFEPADAKALAGLGMVKCAQDKDKEAFTCFSKALDSEPENLTALGELVKCAYRLERYSEAEHYLEDFLRYHPANLDMLFSQAGVQYRSGRYDAALDTVEKLLIFAPDYEGGKELKKKIESMPLPDQATEYQYMSVG
ncbi:MAG TPA: tetratricopeptide repeat protein, partial [Geobacteraceae bacterium]|nr:tetratricopeptide repeat protein [Geobacteraceae bacterium]